MSSEEYWTKHKQQSEPCAFCGTHIPPLTDEDIAKAEAEYAERFPDSADEERVAICHPCYERFCPAEDGPYFKPYHAQA